MVILNDLKFSSFLGRNIYRYLVINAILIATLSLQWDFKILLQCQVSVPVYISESLKMCSYVQGNNDDYTENAAGGLHMIDKCTPQFPLRSGLPGESPSAALARRP